MDWQMLLYGLGSAGVFASRAFLPAFVTALCMRLGVDFKALQGIGDVPVWFTHWGTIAVLGGLSVLEVAATKVPEARQALEDVHHYLKTGLAVLTCAGIVGAKEAGFAEGVLQQAGFVGYTFAAIVGGGVYFLASARQALLGVLTEADEDDDLGVQGILSWMEDLWGTAGILMLLAFPVIMVICIAIIAGLMVLMEKRAERKEEESKVPCANCETPIYPSAVQCPKCSTAVEAPRKIGVWGQPKEEATEDPKNHPYRLVEKKRCPVCATRFEERKVHQTCSECGHELMKETAFQDGYVAYVAERFPVVCGVSFLLSLIPVVGLIPGVIYYRMALVAPFRRYIPLHRSFMLKWLIRLFFFLLIGIQWIPGLGGFALPIMATISFVSYRSTFRGLAAGQ